MSKKCEESIWYRYWAIPEDHEFKKIVSRYREKIVNDSIVETVYYDAEDNKIEIEGCDKKRHDFFNVALKQLRGMSPCLQI